MADLSKQVALMTLLLAIQWAAVTKNAKTVPATWAKELVEIL